MERVLQWNLWGFIAIDMTDKQSFVAPAMEYACQREIEALFDYTQCISSRICHFSSKVQTFATRHQPMLCRGFIAMSCICRAHQAAPCGSNACQRTVEARLITHSADLSRGPGFGAPQANKQPKTWSCAAMVTRFKDALGSAGPTIRWILSHGTDACHPAQIYTVKSAAGL